LRPMCVSTGRGIAVKKRVAQGCYYGVYCLLALWCILKDLGVFTGQMNKNALVFYTNLSNIFCFVFMASSLVRVIRGEVDAGRCFPAVKFIFTMMILVTTLVYNLLLYPYGSMLAYIADTKSFLYHLVLPVMFVLDWLIFYKRGSVKPLYPVYALTIPLTYVGYILLRAAIVKARGMTVDVMYPYFFLNVDRLGWQGFLLWMAILLVSLLALGYGLYGLDHLICRKK